MIPADTQKPENLRKNRKAKTPDITTAKRPLPIGVSDFRVACDQYYYIDKTMLIKDFIDARPIVSLFTRPRGFGKTLTMDMLRTFFELSEEDTSRYFTDKKIWACGESYRSYQGKYPVIFLTFKDERLNMLLQGESFMTLIDTSVIYPQIKKNPSSIYSFLLVAGYLKVLNTAPSFSGDFMCEVALPNREIAYVYNKEILEKLDSIVPQSVAIAIQEAICTNNADALKKQLRKLLLESVSCYDTVGENFYHGLVLGLCVITNNRYYITSNRESGEGRYDIQLMPRDITKPGILIELKAAKNCSDEELKALAKIALQKINEKKYDIEMATKGIEHIFKYGVAFSGKQVEVAIA